MNFTESEILSELDLAFNGIPSSYFPEGKEGTIRYNFFFDLEHGYFSTAGSKIHLYADSTRWAIIIEKNGYGNRSLAAEIELNYVGNCVKYPVQSYPDRDYISNSKTVILISPDEYDRIANKEGSEMEQFELISSDAREVKIRGIYMPIELSIQYVSLRRTTPLNA